MSRALQALPESPADKRRYVRAMFSEIAPRYDLLNHLLSFRIDHSWRRAAIAELGWERRPEGTYLDACAGTLDLSERLARRPGFRGRVLATDFALPMLRLGSAKVRTLGVRMAAADTLRLPAHEAAFEGAMVGFGLRNLASLDEGLAELFRVLKPGGRLVVLDFGMPRLRPVRSLYLIYFRRVLPWIGRLISGHPNAYRYLPESVSSFPDPQGVVARLEAAGFRDCGYRPLTAGVVALSWGVR